MSKDFFPDSYQNQRDWAKNIVDNTAGKVAGVEGWDAARISAFTARARKIQDAAQAVLDAQNALNAASGTLADVIDTELPEIRQDVGNLKKSRRPAGFRAVRCRSRLPACRWRR